jgi:predicted O-methyltransferase YrrM
VDEGKMSFLQKINKAYKKIINYSSKNIRPMFQYIKKKHTKKSDLVGVEIGVCEGYNAHNILSELDIKKIYLVDPYIPFENRGIKYDHSAKLKQAQDRLSRFKDKTEFVVKKSQDAVDDIPDNLDFVYIDGNHDYEFVKRDIEMYYSKLKNGGIIGGHDFRPDYHGVVRAVVEFSEKNNEKIHGFNDEGTDWWIVKEKTD